MKLINCFIVCLFSVAISFAHENSDERRHLLRSWYHKEEGTSCATDRGEHGRCTYFNKCYFMKKLWIHVAPTDSNVSDYISNSLCGNFEHNMYDTYICCPVERNKKGQDIYGIKKYLPETPNCGVTATSNEVAADLELKTSKLGSFPWLGNIGFKPHNASARPGKRLWLCTGVLITERYVLTATHCNHASTGKIDVVRFGSIRMSNKDTGDGSKPLYIKVGRVIGNRQQYTNRKNSVGVDIALLRLVKTVKFSRLVKPICLPHTLGDLNNNYYFTFPIVAGWGHIGHWEFHSINLRQIYFPVWHEYQATESYRKINISIGGTIIAGYSNGVKENCVLDAGGPLMLPIGHTTYIIGIESYGDVCAVRGFPPLFTAVVSYTNWIADKIEEDIVMNQLE